MRTLRLTRLPGLALVAATGLLYGCATGVTISDSDRASLKTSGAPVQTLLYTSMGSNGLMVLSSKTAMAVGGSGFLAIKNGKEWTQEHGLGHPLAPVRDRLVGKLKSDYGVYSFKPVTQEIDAASDTPEKLREQLGAKGIVLDLTGVYQVIYYATNFSRFHMYYNARARLVRLDDGKVLWQANCRTDVEDPDNKPNLDELKANNAARLKEWLNRGAAECSNQLVQTLGDAKT
jgi:hypothetical protein